MQISTIAGSRLLDARSTRKRGLLKDLRSTFAKKSVRRRTLRIGFIVSNALLLAVVSFFVFHARTSSANAILTKSDDKSAAVNPLDQVSSADIAVTVSRMSGLAESTAIKNQSESDDVQVAAAPVTNDMVSKPQVSASTFASNKDIKQYVVVAGDTVTSIAAKFNVTSQSVRWSNGLNSDTVGAGTTLYIPPAGLSGIVYVVKAGDTIDSLAAKYQADKSQLIAANDAEINGIQVGERIIIPGGQQPAAPVVRAATSSYSGGGFAWGGSAVYGYNGYDYGYCTWWVANRRAAVGMPVPANLGNASTWPYYARSAGMRVDNTPSQYAAAVTSTRGEGHVVFVESVNADGSINISEMNHLGWNVTDYATIPASTAASYIYIH
jgi:surface antigen